MQKVCYHILTSIAVIYIFTLVLACKSEDPKKENVPEIVTKVKLEFTPEEGDKVTASATDPDNDGPRDIKTDGAITLAAETTYTLSVSLINELNKPGEDGYDVTEEVRTEGDEHQFFYAWTEGVFSSPAGGGNIDKSGEVNYTDKDKNDLPIGLTTSWTTGEGDSTGTFRILLQHQPGIKSSTSSSKDGESDIDITFDLIIR